MPGLLLCRGTVPIATQAYALKTCGEALGIGRTVGEPIEAAHYPPATIGHQAHALHLTGAPAYGITGRDVEMHAPGLGSIKHQTPVHLEKGIVGAHEDRMVRGVLHRQLHATAPRIQGNRSRTKQALTRFHVASSFPAPIGCSTCSTRMPSPNRHSSLMVPMSSATPSSTSPALSVLWPTRSTSS